MEYSVDQNVWKPITANTITGISAGDYYVRYKETANYYASGATKVTVKMSVPDGGTTEDVTTEEVVSTENQTTEKTDADKPDDQKNTGVKTGDDFAMKTAVAGMIISLGLAGIVVINKRRK